MKKVLIMLALVVGAVSFSKAQGGGGFQQQTPEERLKRSLAALEPLKLTEEQTKKATAVFTAQAKTQDSLRTAANGDFQSMMPKMQEMRTATDSKIMALLTDEQKKAYAEIVKNRPQRGPGGQGPAPAPASN